MTPGDLLEARRARALELLGGSTHEASLEVLVQLEKHHGPGQVPSEELAAIALALSLLSLELTGLAGALLLEETKTARSEAA